MAMAATLQPMYGDYVYCHFNVRCAMHVPVVPVVFILKYSMSIQLIFDDA